MLFDFLIAIGGGAGKGEETPAELASEVSEMGHWQRANMARPYPQYSPCE